ncbi:MAG: helix-turn-helix transcriptional regulator [Gemmatimonadaceae bacterium]|nr:helix-turn-helix transcriptional regulator [Gemmatimonadaceae bacterium]
MAGKPVFTEEQHEVLHACALRVWKRFKAEKKTQEDMALALGISQQSVSDLLKGSYRPGYRPARMLANLDGKKLEQLLEGFSLDVEPGADAVTPRPLSSFANLDVCIQFYASSKHWSAWTIAAARAGFFGGADFAPPEWAAKLDILERALDRARKVA